MQRLNRFVALVEDPRLGQRRAHVPNSGRLDELLVPGRRGVVTGETFPGRKTDCDLTLVELEEGGWACIDARLPAKILEAGWEAVRKDPSFQGWEIVRREPVYGEGRFDLLLQKNGDLCFIETKSVTLVQKGMALFPDAPTPRGRRHMQELCRAVREGYRAAVFFIVQRADAESFAPYDERDASFGQTLREASRCGVGVYSFLCRVDPEGIALDRPLRLCF